jgi:hypothetical protein
MAHENLKSRPLPQVRAGIKKGLSLEVFQGLIWKNEVQLANPVGLDEYPSITLQIHHPLILILIHSLSSHAHRRPERNQRTGTSRCFAPLGGLSAD